MTENNPALNTAVYLLLQAFSDVVEQGWRLAKFEVIGGFEIVGHFHQAHNSDGRTQTLSELTVRKRFVYTEPTDEDFQTLKGS